MRLLVDLQGMQNNSRDRGIGRYVTALARGILRNARGHEVHFLLNDLFPDSIGEVVNSFAGLAPDDHFHVFSAPGPTARLPVENAWRSHAASVIYDKAVHDLAPDVLLIGSLFEGGTDNTVVSVGPDKRGYAVATILYDLIPLLDPEGHLGSDAARAWYFGKVDEARRADLLLGISHSACDEGIQHLPSDRDHVRYVGAAAAEEFTAQDFRQLKGEPHALEALAYHGITRPFLMHTSAFDPRKNFEGLIDAFARLPLDLRKAHQLVLVCKLSANGRRQLLKRIAAAGLTEDDVILTGFVPDDELRMLYANCALMVFPSFHEGFGLPVVEAMWCGAPAVGSSVSSVPEVIGRADAQFDPQDTDAMIRVITRALSDGAYRQELLAHAPNHARSFSWDSVAQRVLSAIEEKHAVWQRSRVQAEPPVATSTETVIAAIARLPGWPGPSDADLLAAARSLAHNEQLTWPQGGSQYSRIHNAAALC